MSESRRVLIALGAAVVGGIAIATSGIAPLIRAADFIAPVRTLWVNAIRMTVIPLIASLLVLAVSSAADVKSIGRIGGRTLLVFFLLLAGTAIVVIPLAPTFSRLLPQHADVHQLPTGSTEAAGELTAGGQAQTFSGWLTSLLPSNPIAAAATGATLPLILFILLFALAIARSPALSRETPSQFFRALGDAMLVLVRWVILMAPIGVFALVLPLAVHAGAALAGAIGFYILAYSIESIARHATALCSRLARGADSDPSLWTRRASGAAHRLQLQLVYRSAASASRERRSATWSPETGHGIRPPPCGIYL